MSAVTTRTPLAGRFCSATLPRNSFHRMVMSSPGLAASRAYRDHLLATSGFVTIDLGDDPRLRGTAIKGRVRGTWVAPLFQFDTTGRLLPKASDLARVLEEFAEPNDGGWSAIFWCFQPRTDLDGQTPAEMFEADPECVIRAAKDDLLGPADTAW